MAHYLARALHIVLALAVLFSSAGFTVDKHFCGGKLKNASIFIKAKGCAGRAEHGGCAKSRHCTAQRNWTKKSCCHNTLELHKLSQDQKTDTSAVFLFKHAIPFAVILTGSAFSLLIPETPVSAFLRYKPPVRYCDAMHAFLQVFRF